tara:strand:- start:2108 stop:2791 length:684 start_codon:yes stop_codon:yes gene_type:complete
MKLSRQNLNIIIEQELKKLLSESLLSGIVHPNPSQIGLQVFATKRGPFNQDRLDRYTRKGRIYVYSSPQGTSDKPAEAFWTSTLKNNTSGWLDLCRDPDFWEAGAGEQAVIYEILPEAKVLLLRSPEDYNAIRQAYPIETFQGGADMYVMFGGYNPIGGSQNRDSKIIQGIDWGKLSKDYDAIYCTNKDCALGWDTESIAWWNLNVLKQIKIVDINDQCELVMDGGN